MKYITLIKNDKDGNELGRQDNFPIAESIDDILKMVDEDNGWNEEEIVAAFNGGSRVKRQTQLGKAPESNAVKAFKRLSREEQQALLATLPISTEAK